MKQGLSCYTINSSLHSNLNLTFTQRKLCNISTCKTAIVLEYYSCADIVLLLCQHCFVIVPTLYCYCADIVLLLHQHCIVIVPILFCYCADIVLLLCRHCSWCEDCIRIYKVEVCHTARLCSM